MKQQQLSFSVRSMLPESRARGELGMQRAADGAERVAPGWCGQAVEEVRRFIKQQGGMLTMEMIRLQIERTLPRGGDKRAWGVVTRMAVARGYIERVEGKTFPAASSNSSPKPLWRKGPQA